MLATGSVLIQCALRHLNTPSRKELSDLIDVIVGTPQLGMAIKDEEKLRDSVKRGWC
jgi:hypothetical protein